MVTSEFGTSYAEIKRRELLRHIPSEEQVRQWVRHTIWSLDARNLIPAYLERHGLTELPMPEYVSADTCYVYRPISDDSGNVTGYRRIVTRGLPDTLISAIEKDFLLAPPPKGSETVVVEPEHGPAGGAVQTDIEKPAKTNPEKVHCERAWNNGKKCGRAFVTQGRLRRHIREKHAEVTKK